MNSVAIHSFSNKNCEHMKAIIKYGLIIPVCFILILIQLNGCNDDNEVNLIKDGDGNVYTPIKIGSMMWLSENLKTTRFTDGTPIPLVTGVEEWADLSSPAYCWYDNDPKHKMDFGGLYNGYAVQDSRGLCPYGWHISTDADWIEMELALGLPDDQAYGLDDRGMDQNVGGKLKATTHWATPNVGADNSSGFTAYGHGCRRYPGHFEYYETDAGYYTATREGAELWIRYLGNWHSGVYRNTRNLNYGYAIRCVKD
jgi:uncharacterized protein (TIGR02145 family)